MRDQRNQGKKNEYKFWTKGVALLAAVTLLVTTLGSDMGSWPRVITAQVHILTIRKS